MAPSVGAGRGLCNVLGSQGKGHSKSQQKETETVMKSLLCRELFSDTPEEGQPFCFMSLRSTQCSMCHHA